jgi:hypothetical protein
MITSDLEKIVSHKDFFAFSIGSKTRRNSPLQLSSMENSYDSFGLVVLCKIPIIAFVNPSEVTMHNSTVKKTHLRKRTNAHTQQKLYHIEPQLNVIPLKKSY